MKFCTAIGHYPKITPGGAEFQAYLIGKELAKRGHDVHYVAYQSEPRETITDDGISVHKLDCDYDPPNVPASVLSTIRNIDPDYVYLRNFQDVFMLEPLGERINGEVIFNISHDHQCLRLPDDWRALVTKSNLSEWIRNPSTLLQRRHLKKADYMFVQTSKQQRLLRENYGLTSTLIGNGHPIPEGTIRKDEPPVVLWLASLKPWKRPEKFVRIAEQCTDLDCQFEIIGRPSNDETHTEVQRAVSGLTNIKYKGSCTIAESNAHVGRASVFVNTSESEGFPNTFIQSWLRRTPVLSLEVDPDGILSSNPVGEFADGNLNRLVHHTRRLIADGDVREEYATASRDYAIKNHSIESVVDRLVDALDGKIGAEIS